MTLTIYGDSISGNCLKVKWTAQRLNLPYEWIEVDVVGGETRGDSFRRLNPAAQVPTVLFRDGRTLAQSNAIVLHLAEGSDLIPKDAYWRAKMLEWMFWEQYSHEPFVAVRRFQRRYLNRPEAELDPKLLEGGHRALSRMEVWLEASPYMVGETLSCADIALVAYTRVAHEGGFDLGSYPAVATWVQRVERDLGLLDAEGAFRP
jgi:glutathione S-transferase